MVKQIEKAEGRGRRTWIVPAAVIGVFAGVVAWKELPALIRYIRMERM